MPASSCAPLSGAMRKALAAITVVGSAAFAHAEPSRDGVRAIVAEETRRQLGERWVPVALRIAHVESGFNPRAVGPRTRHGRALGVFQVMPGSARALGYDPRRLLEPRYGAAAGVAHMRLCIAHGVRTDAEMARCHLAGVGGWKRRGDATSRRYVALVTGGAR